jgi:two-component system, OmpR family, phosphate regulon sensor histidine kinase PhoR
MKNLSEKKAIVLLSFFSSALASIVFLFSMQLMPEETWLVPFFCFPVVFLLSCLCISLIFKDLLKPLYFTDKYLQEKGTSLKSPLSSSPEIITSETNPSNGTEEIHELKKLEKYRREFLGNVMHELKTPIFNIQGYVLTLLEGGIEDKKINKVYLERTVKSIDRMVNIVEDLEAISRLESGELKLEMEPFNLVALVEEVFEMQDMRAKKNDIKLLFVERQKIIKVTADRRRLLEAMNNLVVNAIKYNKKNGKVIVGYKDLGDKIKVEVADTGIGIPETELPRIFERFYRVDKSRSREMGGTGLGLAIVKHIIEAHGQKLTVQSKINEGTIFSFTLEKSE